MLVRPINISIIVIILFISFISAQNFGYNYLSQPQIELNITSNVSSVSSGDGCIFVSPNTGDVIISFNTSCGGSGSTSWIISGSDIYYSAGNVGIGTNNPANPLNVIGRINASNMVLESSSPSIIIDDTDGASAQGKFLIRAKESSPDALIFSGRDNSDASWIDWLTLLRTSGYLGIGTTTPSHTLNVNGDVNITGRLGLGNNADIDTVATNYISQIGAVPTVTEHTNTLIWKRNNGTSDHSTGDYALYIVNEEMQGTNFNNSADFAGMQMRTVKNGLGWVEEMYGGQFITEINNGSAQIASSGYFRMILGGDGNIGKIREFYSPAFINNGFTGNVTETWTKIELGNLISHEMPAEKRQIFMGPVANGSKNNFIVQAKETYDSTNLFSGRTIINGADYEEPQSGVALQVNGTQLISGGNLTFSRASDISHGVKINYNHPGGSFGSMIRMGVDPNTGFPGLQIATGTPPSGEPNSVIFSRSISGGGFERLASSLKYQFVTNTNFTLSQVASDAGGITVEGLNGFRIATNVGLGDSGSVISTRGLNMIRTLGTTPVAADQYGQFNQLTAPTANFNNQLKAFATSIQYTGSDTYNHTSGIHYAGENALIFTANSKRNINWIINQFLSRTFVSGNIVNINRSDGLYIARPTGMTSNTVINNTYGIYIEDQRFATNNFSIYSEGGNAIFDGGRMCINCSTFHNSTPTLQVNGEIYGKGYFTYSDMYAGDDALKDIQNIKMKDGTKSGNIAQLDDSSLPDGIKKLVKTPYAKDKKTGEEIEFNQFISSLSERLKPEIEIYEETNEKFDNDGIKSEETVTTGGWNGKLKDTLTGKTYNSREEFIYSNYNIIEKEIWVYDVAKFGTLNTVGIQELINEMNEMKSALCSMGQTKYCLAKDD